MRFGFLSTYENLLLPYFINYSIREGLNDICIFLDSKEISTKNKSIFQERTAGYFGKFSKINTSLHKLSNYKIPLFCR